MKTADPADGLHGRMPPARRSADATRGTRAIFDTAFDGLAIVDDARRFVDLNDALGSLLAADSGTLVGTAMDQRVSVASLPILARIWSEAEIRGSASGHLELRPDDASSRLIELRVWWDYAPGLRCVAVRAIRRAGAGSASGLTQREREILGLVCDGLSNREISATLYISTGTVKIHLERVYAKLGVANRAAAVAHAFRNGLIA